MNLNDADRLNLPTFGPPGLDPLWDDIDGRHYDRSGNLISARDWMRLFAIPDRSYRVVKQEDVGTYWVSTVWLGLDHGWGDTPLFFETMVFGKDDEGDVDASDLACRRYPSEAAALAGHAEVVNEVSLMVAAADTGSVRPADLG